MSHELILDLASPQVLPFETFVLSLYAPDNILTPYYGKEAAQDAGQPAQCTTRSSVSSSSSSPKDNDSHPQPNEQPTGGSRVPDSGASGSGGDDEDDKKDQRKKIPAEPSGKSKKSKKGRKGTGTAAADDEDDDEPDAQSLPLNAPDMWSVRSRAVSHSASASSLSSLSSMGSIFTGDDVPSGSGSNTDPSSIFNEATSSGEDGLRTEDVDRLWITAAVPHVQEAVPRHEPEAIAAPLARKRVHCVYYIKREFSPGDPEDPDGPDGPMPGDFADMPSVPLPSASPITLCKILNFLWKILLVYALFGAFIATVKVTKSGLIRLLHIIRQASRGWEIPQRLVTYLKSFFGNGTHTTCKSRPNHASSS
jgi:hypothetical protein